MGLQELLLYAVADGTVVRALQKVENVYSRPSQDEEAGVIHQPVSYLLLPDCEILHTDDDIHFETQAGQKYSRVQASLDAGST
jgi:hypothetical protein